MEGVLYNRVKGKQPKLVVPQALIQELLKIRALFAGVYACLNSILRLNMYLVAKLSM